MQKLTEFSDNNSQIISFYLVILYEFRNKEEKEYSLFKHLRDTIDKINIYNLIIYILIFISSLQATSLQKNATYSISSFILELSVLIYGKNEHYLGKVE